MSTALPALDSRRPLPALAALGLALAIVLAPGAAPRLQAQGGMQAPLVDLGTPAPAPAPEPYVFRPQVAAALSQSSEFSVTPSSRAASRAFYNSVFLAVEGIPSGWNGSTSGHIPGTLSAEFLQAMRQRVNWYRAMAGVPASIGLNSTWNNKAQQAALMMARATALSHTPPASPTTQWPYATADGREAAGMSNLALGTSGYDSIYRYILDSGSNNASVGHRNWMLHPPIATMGAGSVDEQYPYYAAQALWVNDGNAWSSWPTVRDSSAGVPIVAWPPPGYVPYQQVFPRWSCAIQGPFGSQYFKDATVTMTKNGSPLAVNNVLKFNSSTSQDYGLGTSRVIIFTPADFSDASSANPLPRPSSDATYVVTISNVKINSSTFTLSYTVRPFDPALPAAGELAETISGPANPAVGTPQTYTHTTASMGAYATSYRLLEGTASPYSGIQGAESSTSLNDFTISTAHTTAKRQSSVKYAGSWAFRLVHMGSLEPEILEWNKDFIPSSTSTLNLRSRLGNAQVTEHAHIQISTDGGASWRDFRSSGFPKTGNGGSNQSTFEALSFSLAEFAGRPVRFRFTYETSLNASNSYEWAEGTNAGWFIDELQVTNAQEYSGITTSTIAQAAGSFSYTPSDLTPRTLAVQAVGWQDYAADISQVLTISPTPPTPEILASSARMVEGQIWVEFQVSNLTGLQNLSLLSHTDPAATFLPYTTGVTLVTVNLLEGRFCYQINLPGDGTRFFKVGVTL